VIVRIKKEWEPLVGFFGVRLTNSLAANGPRAACRDPVIRSPSRACYRSSVSGKGVGRQGGRASRLVWQGRRHLPVLLGCRRCGAAV